MKLEVEVCWNRPEKVDGNRAVEYRLYDRSSFLDHEVSISSLPPTTTEDQIEAVIFRLIVIAASDKVEIESFDDLDFHHVGNCPWDDEGIDLT